MDVNTNSRTVTKTVINVEGIIGLVPYIVHNGSNISPASGVAQNFSTNNTYTVTAINGTTSDYTVTLTSYYGVIINTAGGLITQAPTTEYVLHGAKASPPSDPYQAYYGFKGWYDAPSGGNIFNFTTTDITTKTTIYAQWTNKQYQVRFYRGAKLLNTVSVVSLTAISVSDYPVNPNAGKAYRWHSNANLGGVYNKDSLVITDVDLYAQEVSVSFEMIIEDRMIPSDLANYDDMSEMIFSNYTAGATVATRYVKEVASGSGDGSSWDNAANDIRAMINGINDASENKVYVILVARELIGRLTVIL